MTIDVARGDARPGDRRGQRLLAAFVVALLGGSATVGASPPDPADDVDPTVAAPPSDDVTPRSDTVLTGYRATASQDFVVPAGRRPVEDGAARATFRLPDLVTDVVVSAELNGAPIGSWLLGSGPTVTSIDIPLPIDAIEPGGNRLRLDAVIPLVVDGTCPQSRHPARWIELLDDISVVVPTETGLATPLTGFPAAMENDLATTTVIVDGLAAPQLTAAATIGAVITEELGRDHTLRVTTDPDDALGSTVSLSVTTDRPGISIGSDEQGLPHVEIRAADPTDLAGLATVLADAGSRAQMTGSSIDAVTALGLAVGEPTTRLREAGPDWLAGLTLDELGYGPTTLDGPGQDRATYSFEVPVGDISSFMTIAVDATASAGGAEWDPAIDVYVNGRLVGNGTLGDELDSFEIEVPNQVLRPGTNFVRLEADFGSTDECGAESLPTRRIDIMGSTTLRLRHGSPLVPDLDDLPYLLRSSTDTAGTAVVPPSDPSLAEAERAVRLAVLLGGRGRAAGVVTPDDTDTIAAATHLVLIGTPERQPHLETYTRALPLGSAVPARWPAEIEAQLDGVRHGASIQLAATERDGVLLAIVAERDDDAIAALDVLLDAELRSGLVGTMALVAREPLTAASVVYEGTISIDDERTTSSDGAVDGAAATPTDRSPAATAAVAPPTNTDRTPTGRRTELFLIASGIAVLAAGLYAMRRFGVPGQARSAGA